MDDSVFKLIYFILFVLITIVRTAHTTKYRKLEIEDDRKSLIDVIMLALAGIAMLLPLVYLFFPFFDFADYYLPPWIGWLGVILFVSAIWMLWRSHVELGRNWTPTLGIRSDHQLVTDGIFKYMRHPMYAAHILWGIATVLMLHNWIAGCSMLFVFFIQYSLRVDIEEQMMLERFGEPYQSYMQRTGRIFPRFKREGGG